MDRKKNPLQDRSEDTPNMLQRIPALVLTLLALCPALASAEDHWVGTWATAPVSAVNTDASIGAAETTYRQIVHVSLGGDTSRIILTNEFGLTPLTVNSAYIALRPKDAKGSEI